MVFDPIPQSLPVHFFGSRPQPHLSATAATKFENWRDSNFERWSWRGWGGQKGLWKHRQRRTMQHQMKSIHSIGCADLRRKRPSCWVRGVKGAGVDLDMYLCVLVQIYRGNMLIGAEVNCCVCVDIHVYIACHDMPKHSNTVHAHARTLSLTHTRFAHSHMIALPEGGIASNAMLADARDLLSIWLETGELIRDQISGKSLVCIQQKPCTNIYHIWISFPGKCIRSG